MLRYCLVSHQALGQGASLTVLWGRPPSKSMLPSKYLRVRGRLNRELRDVEELGLVKPLPGSGVAPICRTANPQRERCYFCAGAAISFR
jgi:hypothetical protein